MIRRYIDDSMIDVQRDTWIPPLEKKEIFANGMQWFSRTIAIFLLMLGPGLLGRGLDRRLGTQFLTPIGFVLGTVLATFILILLARKLTPPARGDPLPFDDDDDQEQDARGLTASGSLDDDDQD